MMPDIVIRRAASADLPTIGKLGALLVQVHYDFDPLRFIQPTRGTPAGYASFLGSQLEEPEVLVIVAERAGAVIGYAYAAMEGRDYMSLRDRAGVLHDIIVEPSARRSGAGRRLLAEVLAFFKSRGEPRVVLSTAARNEPAQRLFASMGFRETMIEMTRELDD
jgi:ribosomal protein S18 acetylase RimI-like enzyme